MSTDSSTAVDTDLAARAAFASHRLIGWIFWDPEATQRYAALGVPDGIGYYIATRAAPLAPAGNAAVAAAFGTISRVFIDFSLDLARTHTTFADAYSVRNEAVGDGLRRYAPEICEPLAAQAPALWEVVDALPLLGRVLFAAHATAPRWDDVDPVVSAWLALNCIREWRGDTHFAVLAAADIGHVEAGLLHDAWMGYDGEWITRSRGGTDAEIDAAFATLEARGLAADRCITEAGLALRADLERRTDELGMRPWQVYGAERTVAFCELIESVGDRLVERIDATAGPNWMPAARTRRRS